MSLVSTQPIILCKKGFFLLTFTCIEFYLTFYCPVTILKNSSYTSSVCVFILTMRTTSYPLQIISLFSHSLPCPPPPQSFQQHRFGHGPPQTSVTALNCYNWHLPSTLWILSHSQSMSYPTALWIPKSFQRKLAWLLSTSHFVSSHTDHIYSHVHLFNYFSEFY